MTNSRRLLYNMSNFHQWLNNIKYYNYKYYNYIIINTIIINIYDKQQYK